MPRQKKHRRAIVIPDQHFPIHDQEAVNVVLKAIELVKPNIFINLGDVGEWEAFSHWKFKRKKAPPLEYLIEGFDADVKEVNAGMDWIDESLDKAKVKERHFVQGNHEVWLDNFVTRYPYLDQYNTKDALKLDKRGYKYYPQGEFLTIGDLGSFFIDKIKPGKDVKPFFDEILVEVESIIKYS